MSEFKLSTSPAFRFALVLIAGILASCWLEGPAILMVLLLSGSVVAAVAVFLLSKKHQTWDRVLVPLTLLVCVLSGATKYVFDSDRSLFVPDSLLLRDILVVGRIVETPHEAPKVTRFLMVASEVKRGHTILKTNETVRVSIMRKQGEAIPPDVHYGATVIMRGKLLRPADTRNPGEFSEKQYYEANGITMFMLVRGRSDVIVIDSTEASWLMSNVVAPVYEYVIRLIDSTAKGESAEFLKGLLIGERSGISVPTRQAFTNSGVAHVLAVSGSNVVVVAAIFFFLFGLLRFPKWTVVLLSIVVLVLYMLVTGSQPPVVRATIASSIFLMGGLLQSKPNPYNSLGAAAVASLLIDSRQLFDVGFQLSFTAVLSIVYLYPKMNNWISALNSGSFFRKAIVWTLRVCAVSFAASLGTLPLTAVYFGKVSVIGLLANIAVIPAVGGSVVLGFVTIFANLLSNWVAGTYAAVNQLLLDVTLWVIQVSGNVSFASVDTSRFLPLYTLPFYTILLLFFNLNSRPVARKLVFVCLVALNIVVFTPAPPAVAASNDRLRVTFLDVGQGDASVIESADGRVIVIDAGPASEGYDSGERVVAPFLRRRGISTIDLLVISHPHDDHMGGASYLVQHFPVREVLQNGQPVDIPMFRKFAQDLGDEHCRVDTGRAGGCVRDFRDLRLYLLAPVPAFIDTDLTNRINLNNTSVVTQVRHGEVSFLFAGDAEKDAEQEMAGRYGDFLGSTLLKAGHHGSRTSSTQEFLDRVRPVHAVVSVGRLNKFRHPSAEVINRLRAMGVELHRTDEEGAIMFESDGKTLTRVEWR